MSKNITRRQLIAGGAGLIAGSSAFGKSGNDMTNISGDQTIRAYQIGKQDGLASLSMGNKQLAPPRDEEVLVRVRAAALNHRDLSIMEGQLYGGSKPSTRVPLGDGAGDVIAVGEQVTGLEPGDRVTAPHLTDWIDGDFDRGVFASDLGNSMDGWLAEIIRLPARACVKLPEKLSYQSAAALGIAGITA